MPGLFDYLKNAWYRTTDQGDDFDNPIFDMPPEPVNTNSTGTGFKIHAGIIQGNPGASGSATFHVGSSQKVQMKTICDSNGRGALGTAQVGPEGAKFSSPPPPPRRSCFIKVQSADRGKNLDIDVADLKTVADLKAKLGIAGSHQQMLLSPAGREMMNGDMLKKHHITEGCKVTQVSRNQRGG